MRGLSIFALALGGLGAFGLSGCNLGPQDQAAIASNQVNFQAALDDFQRLVATANEEKEAAEARAKELQAAYDQIAHGGLSADALIAAVAQLAGLQGEAQDAQKRWEEAQAAATSAWGHVQEIKETSTETSKQTGTSAWLLALLGALGPISAAAGQAFNTYYRGLPSKGAGARKRNRTIAEGPAKAPGPPLASAVI